MKTVITKRILDAAYMLRREKVWKYMREIDEYQWLNPDFLIEFQWKKLKKMLSFAYENIPYYQDQWQKLDIHPDDIKSTQDFKALPILTKEDLRNNNNLLKSNNNNLRVSLRQTSGSSGTPLTIGKDRQTTAYMDAVMYRSYLWYGIKPGERQLKIWGTEINKIRNFKMRFKDFLLNRIRLSAFELSRKSFLNAIERIKTFKPVFIYGYAQSVFEFAKFITDEKIELVYLELKAVIITGEMIFDWQREIIKQAFACPVVNEYGCTEVGIISIECPKGGMHIMQDALFLEFVESDSNTEQREIVVTELNNFYSPLIRYKVGDKGIMSDSLCPCGRGFQIMSEISGRADNFIIFPGGKKVDPYVIEYIIKTIPSNCGIVNQFVIIQDNISSITLKLVCNTFTSQKILHAINNKWNKLYGKELNLKIEFVDTIPKDSSGKLTCFKSLLNR
jgi:phenylacetate-CoA ligase